MNNLKKVLLVILTIGFSSAMFAQDAPAQDAPFEKGEAGLFPGLKKGFHPQISIAPQAGYIGFLAENSPNGGLAYGFEIAMQCPLACTKKNYIRQQASFLIHFDDNFTFWNATLNPEYRIIANTKFELAAGPALGLAGMKYTFESPIPEVEIDDIKETFFTYGLSTSATFHFNKIYVAVSPRLMFGGVKDASANSTNFQGLVKLGLKL